MMRLNNTVGQRKMSFALHFIDRRKKLASIRAGAFVEKFTVAAGSTTESLEEVWRRELGTLLGRKKKIVLHVSGRRRAITRAWVVYRIGEMAFIQDRMFPNGFDQKKNRIPKRETVAEDSRQISEWPVEIAAIHAFLRKEANKSGYRQIPGRSSDTV